MGKIPKSKPQYKALNIRLDNYALQAKRLFRLAAAELAQQVIVFDDTIDTDTQFRFEDYPAINTQAKRTMDAFSQSLLSTIRVGMAAEWANANEWMDVFTRSVLGNFGANPDNHKQYFNHNENALKAFAARSENGMNISRRVWQTSALAKTEIEAAVALAIKQGTSAIELSKRIMDWLDEPEEMRNAMRNHFSNAEHIKDCEYRAARLARSEINMAYRTSEQTRWLQSDFVVGYEIKTSKMHDHKVSDICDFLQGKYPKDFIWTGWHPNCMCYAVPILETEDEFWNDSDTSVNAVTNMPHNFGIYVNNNSNAIMKSLYYGKAPYWVNDNLGEVTKHLDNVSKNNPFANDEKIIEYDLNGRAYRAWSWGRFFAEATGNYNKVHDLDDISKYYTNGYKVTSIGKELNADIRAGRVSKHQDIINGMKGLIESSALPTDAVLYRYVDYKFTKHTIGIETNNAQSVIKHIQDNNLIGMPYTDNAFTSTSADKYHNIFRDKPIEIRILAPKGTHAFISNNFDESEILLNMGQELILQSVTFNDKTKKLELVYLAS